MVGFTNGIVDSEGAIIDPAAASDAYLQYNESSVAKWRHGNDATDDSWRLSQGSALGTNDMFVMSSSGERTMPLQPAFAARLGSRDSNATGAGTVYTVGTGVAWTELYDLNSDFNTNGTFTAPVTGRYKFDMAIDLDQLSAAMTQTQLSILADSVSYSGPELNIIPILTGGTIRFNRTITASMTASSTAVMKIQVSGGAGNTADIRGASSVITYFSGMLLC